MSAHPRSAATYLPLGLPSPAPSPDGIDAGFWQAAREHRLVVQRCGACGAFQFGPEWICHRCHSGALDWHELPGRGRIYSWMRVWHPVHPALADACPYLVVLVELPDADGVRMVGNLLGDPHQEVAIGATVEAVFEDQPSGDVTLVQWTSAGAA